MNSNPDIFLECYFDRTHRHNLAAKRNLMVRVTASPETLSTLFDLVIVEDTGYSPSVISDMLVPGGKVLIKRRPDAEDKLQIENKTPLRLQAVQSTTDNLLIEAQKSTLPTLNSSSTDPSMPVITFELGQEMDIRDQILLREASAVPIWIQAQDDIHGGAARGFCRSLSRELSTNVRLVVFQGEWSVARRLQFINALSSLPGLDDEVEVLVDPNGILHVPRLVPASPATPLDQGEAPEYWVKGSNGEIIEQSPPLLESEDLVLLRISAISKHSAGGMTSVLGDVASVGASGLTKGTPVVAICSSPTSNFAVIHEGQIFPKPWADADDTVNTLLPLLVAALGLGMRTFMNRNGREATARISVIGSRNDPFTLPLVFLLQSHGYSVSLLSTQEILFEDLQFLESSRYVFCESIPTVWARTLEGLSTCVSIYQWGKDLNQSLMRDPWFVRDTLLQVLPLSTSYIPPLEPALRIQDVLATSRSTRKLLFDPYKKYLLIGGIGSLGLHIALWMYEVSIKPPWAMSHTPADVPL